MALEIIIVLLAIIGVIIAYYLLKTVTHLIINAVLGLIILVAANVIFNVGINYSLPALLVCAFAGIPGAIIVIILHLLGVAFV
ncbi:MAG: transcriptional regulator [Candidatus Methanoperedens sp.]|nr:transcriptional regulator [Candidatus Methanoperedens sp.]